MSIDPTRPLTPRGERTRASLVAAGRAVFERDGYLDSRLADVATEAGCSIGTFYLYFEDKDDLLRAVLDTVEVDMLRPVRPRSREGSRPWADPVARIEAGNRAYLRAYRRNARLMLLLEEVATLRPELRELRRRRGWTFTERNARGIVELQRAGVADAALDPYRTAWALSGMVARMAYYAYALGDAGDPELRDEEALVAAMTRLWVNALGISRS